MSVPADIDYEGIDKRPLPCGHPYAALVTLADGRYYCEVCTKKSSTETLNLYDCNVGTLVSFVPIGRKDQFDEAVGAIVHVGLDGQVRVHWTFFDGKECEEYHWHTQLQRFQPKETAGAVTEETTRDRVR